jgi:hypothetical protein
MRWPWSGGEDEQKKTGLSAWTESYGSDDWATSFLEPRTLIPSLALTVTTVAGVRLYKSYLRRIPTVNHIKPDYFRRRSLFGQVTSVGDADNFRLYHTPGGRLAGWGWLPWKTVPTKRDRLMKQTVSETPLRIYSIPHRLRTAILTQGEAPHSNRWSRCARACALGP